MAQPYAGAISPGGQGWLCCTRVRRGHRNKFRKASSSYCHLTCLLWQSPKVQPWKRGLASGDNLTMGSHSRDQLRSTHFFPMHCPLPDLLVPRVLSWARLGYCVYICVSVHVCAYICDVRLVLNVYLYHYISSETRWPGANQLSEAIGPASPGPLCLPHPSAGFTAVHHTVNFSQGCRGGNSVFKPVP